MDATLFEYDDKSIWRFNRVDENRRRYKVHYNTDGTIRKSYMKAAGKPDNNLKTPFVQGAARERVGYPTQHLKA